MLTPLRLFNIKLNRLGNKIKKNNKKKIKGIRVNFPTTGNRITSDIPITNGIKSLTKGNRFNTDILWHQAR